MRLLPLTLKVADLGAHAYAAHVAEEKSFDCGEDTLQLLTDKYAVAELSGKQLKLVLKGTRKMSTQEALRQAYAAVTEEEKL